jgi:hypothetical protein
MRDGSRVDSASPLLAHVYEQLLVDACRAWTDLETAMAVLAQSAVIDTSQLGRDLHGLGRADELRDLTDYPQARAGNAARLLRSLQAVVLERVPDAAFIDTAAMYPLLRALLEDAATIRWLMVGETARERCLRSLRLLRSDGRYVSDAQNLIQRTLESLPFFVDRTSRSEVGIRIGAGLETVWPGLDRAILHHELEQSELDRRPLQSEIVRGAYGEESVEFATWKLLSNLAHYSYSVERLLPSGAGIDGQGDVVLLVSLVSETNGAVIAAIESLRHALRPA